NYFEDAGDVGSYWTYYPPYENRIFNTLTSAPRVWIEQNGPLAGVIGIEHSMVLPAGGEEPLYGIGKSDRSEQTDVLKIVTKVSLKKDDKYVGVETSVVNNLKNHRLRAGFPTGVITDTAAASGHFTVDERPVIPTKDASGEYWKEMQTLPMQHFVDLSDGERGLALLSNSVTEYEALSDVKGTVYLTLFRAMGNMIVTGWECVNRFPAQNGSQLQRQMDFAYAVYPHQGNWQSADVYAQAERFISQPCVYQTIGNHKGSLPYSGGFLEITDDNLVLSAFKKADDGDGYILRVFNPCDSEITADVIFAADILSANHASMGEESREKAGFAGNRLRVTAAANKIMTYRLVF
ncbi:MAG: glycosyl hydrolase-related protein, partial [Oscillospiraceae bacterium]|nr:glycosyl hydrolase-related protein [Oscillospiraceae bacterium]